MIASEIIRVGEIIFKKGEEIKGVTEEVIEHLKSLGVIHPKKKVKR